MTTKTLTPLTPEERADGMRLCAEKTPGPWSAQNRHSDFGPCYNRVVATQHDGKLHSLLDDYGIDRYEDAAFIAFMGTHAERLLAMIESLATERNEAVKLSKCECSSDELCQNLVRWAARAEAAEAAQAQEIERFAATAAMLRQGAAAIRTLEDLRLGTCDDCGPVYRVDRDGCCVTCGADITWKAEETPDVPAAPLPPAAPPDSPPSPSE